MNRLRRRSRAAVLVILVLIAVAVVAGRRHSACGGPAPGLAAGALGGKLLADLVEVPCPSSGRVSYATRDNLGAQMGALDPIDDPAGGYLGVYHSPTQARIAGQVSYSVALAHSKNLISWTRIRVIDPVGASMATLASIPGDPGYLLAYEKSTGKLDHIRVIYYGTLRALLRGRAGATVDLPVRFSRYSNGTPSFGSIDWRGGLARSIVQLAFHYEASGPGGTPGPDREATGTLDGFRRWTARRDATIDGVLDRLGLLGSHGDRRQFTFNGSVWRIYEAQSKFGDFATWHVLLYDVARNQFEPLELTLNDGSFATSFGNPIVDVLRGPGGHGEVLAVTMFVFGTGGASREAGELVYYQPL